MENDKLKELIERIDFDMLMDLLRNNRGQVLIDHETLTQSLHDVEALQILSKQYLGDVMLDDMVGESLPDSRPVPIDDIEEMFLLAQSMCRIEVEYNENQLEMANETIFQQKKLADKLTIQLAQLV